MTTMAEKPWTARESSLEKIAAQRAALAGRAERIRAGLAELPSKEDRARAKALESGEGSWDALRPLVQQRRELEDELASIRADEESLSVKARQLAEEVGRFKAEELEAQAQEIQARQRERLADVGRHVQAIADAYADIVYDEQALADLRADITGVLGKPNHSLARPVAEPLAATLGLFLDEIAWVATSSAARGSNRWGGKTGLAKAAWLQAIPDLRDSEGAPLLMIDGVDPYTQRVLLQLP